LAYSGPRLNRPELDVPGLHFKQNIRLELVVAYEGVIEADDLNRFRIARHGGPKGLDVDGRFEADDQVAVGDCVQGLGMRV
jgi:hypothetical protein